MIARIARTGPMPVADYMAECLFDPDHGYYATRDPLGRDGDFITAPEVSQMFGELLGLWLAQVWVDQGRPSPFILAELGPGRGTLMADVLRATRAVPGFIAAAEVHLVEASPVLRGLQDQVLPGATFHDSVAALPEGPLILLANEFFDALPIRQFQRTEAGWCERQVGVEGDQLIWGLAPPAPLTAEAPVGHIIETCAPGEAIAQEIGRRIAAFGGAALILDYGDTESRGDTFQAVTRHRFADPLEAPGTVDLTAHVAFGPLARAASPTQASGPVPQGVFLERLGITARAQALARGLGGGALEAHVAAHRRLTHPDEMGTLFKAMALTPVAAPAPPALEPYP